MLRGTYGNSGDGSCFNELSLEEVPGREEFRAGACFKSLINIGSDAADGGFGGLA